MFYSVVAKTNPLGSFGGVLSSNCYVWPFSAFISTTFIYSKFAASKLFFMFSTVKRHQVLLDLQELQAQQELQDQQDCQDETDDQAQQVLKVNAALRALKVWQDL